LVKTTQMTGGHKAGTRQRGWGRAIKNQGSKRDEQKKRGLGLDKQKKGPQGNKSILLKKRGKAGK